MNPKISIVTVVYNGALYIEQTIKSIIEQTYINKEYILIDGASSDETMDIVLKYSDSISCIISEQDKGIYDAMNKGIEYATGDWVIFMNCGDFFYNNEVLSDIFRIEIPQDVALVYGGAHVRSSWGDFFISPQTTKNVWKSFTHQSLFARSGVIYKYKFNPLFRAASDFNFVYSLYCMGYKFLKINMPISDILYIESGFSSVNEILSKKEVLKSIKLHQKNFIILFFHYGYHAIAYLRKRISIIVRRYFPGLISIIRKYRDI